MINIEGREIKISIQTLLAEAEVDITKQTTTIAFRMRFHKFLDVFKSSIVDSLKKIISNQEDNQNNTKIGVLTGQENDLKNTESQKIPRKKK